jgi:hypothetical protein
MKISPHRLSLAGSRDQSAFSGTKNAASTNRGKSPAMRHTPLHLKRGGSLDIFIAPIEGDSGHPKLGKPELFVGTRFVDTYPAFSPDGHWLESNVIQHDLLLVDEPPALVKPTVDYETVIEL